MGAVLHLCCIFRDAEVFIGEDKDLFRYIVLVSNVTSWSQLLKALSKHCEKLQDKPCATAGRTMVKCIACMKQVVTRYNLLVNISMSFLFLLLMINTGASDVK